MPINLQFNVTATQATTTTKLDKFSLREFMPIREAVEAGQLDRGKGVSTFTFLASDYKDDSESERITGNGKSAVQKARNEANATARLLARYLNDHSEVRGDWLVFAKPAYNPATGLLDESYGSAVFVAWNRRQGPIETVVDTTNGDRTLQVGETQAAA